MGGQPSTETTPNSTPVVEPGSPQEETTTKPEVVKSKMYQPSLKSSYKINFKDCKYASVTGKDDSSSQVPKSKVYESSRYKTNFYEYSPKSSAIEKDDSSSKVPNSNTYEYRLSTSNKDICSYSRITGKDDSSSQSKVCESSSYKTNSNEYSPKSSATEKDDTSSQVPKSNIYESRLSTSYKTNFNKDIRSYSSVTGKGDSSSQMEINGSLLEDFCPLYSSQTKGLHKGNSSERYISEKSYSGKDTQGRRAKSDVCPPRSPASNKITFMDSNSNLQVIEEDEPYSKISNAKVIRTPAKDRTNVKDKDVFNTFKQEDSKLRGEELYTGTTPKLFEKAVEKSSHNTSSEESVIKDTGLKYAYRDPLLLTPITDIQAFKKPEPRLENSSKSVRPKIKSTSAPSDECVRLDTKYTIPLCMPPKQYTDMEDSPAIIENKDLRTSESKEARNIDNPARLETKFAFLHIPPSMPPKLFTDMEESPAIIEDKDLRTSETEFAFLHIPPFELKAKPKETTSSAASPHTDTRKTLKAVRTRPSNVFLKSKNDTEVSNLKLESENSKVYNHSQTFINSKTICAGEGNIRYTGEYKAKAPPPKSPHMLKKTPSKTTSLLSFSRRGNNSELNSNSTPTTTDSKKPPQTTTTSSQTDPRDFEDFPCSYESEKTVLRENTVFRMHDKTEAGNTGFSKIGKATLFRRDDFRQEKDSTKIEQRATVTRENSISKKPSSKLYLEAQEDKLTGNSDMRFAKTGKATLIRKDDFRLVKDPTESKQQVTVTRENSISEKPSQKLWLEACEVKPTGPANDVQNLKDRIEKLKTKVEEFKGAEANQFTRQLELDLLECGVELDTIDTNGVEEIRKERKAIRMTMQKALDLLSRKTGSSY